jgi:hypothetical protein
VGSINKYQYEKRRKQFMSFKEMPCEERYNRLYDNLMQLSAITLALAKDQGVIDKYIELSVDVQKKMIPDFLGKAAFKVLKTIAPGRAFNQLSNQFVYAMQRTHSLSEIELAKVSDREAIIRINNCPAVKRFRDVVEKTGLDIDPRFMCEIESIIIPEIIKEFGISAVLDLVEDGCVLNVKL